MAFGAGHSTYIAKHRAVASPPPLLIRVSSTCRLIFDVFAQPSTSTLGRFGVFATKTTLIQPKVRK